MSLIGKTMNDVRAQADVECLAKILWPVGSVVLRVIAVTDTNRGSDRNPSHPEFILTTSSPCYCTPTIEFWLSQDGLENPTAELVMLEIVNKKPKESGSEVYFHVEFDWWDGRYEGYFIFRNMDRLPWANGQQCDGQIVDIKCQV